MIGRTAARLFILSGVLALSGLALLGIPGALWLELASPVAALLSEHRAAADAGWPMAIFQAALWPWVIVPAYLLAVQHTPSSSRRVMTTIAYTTAGALLIALVIQMWGGSL